MDMFSIAKDMFSPVLKYIFTFIGWLLLLVVAAAVLFFVVFWIRYRIRLKVIYLEKLHIKFVPYDLLRWLLWDFLTRGERKGQFREYGFTIYCGPQGSGKTQTMVEYLRRMREKYPKCLIVTNFAYEDADFRLTDWRQLFDIRNSTDGVIFCIDEIHSEYSSAAWKDFPESLLSQISQQRKQRIKIVATSQVFSRVAKPIREQCFTVVCCSAYFGGRLIRCREYDAAEYATSDTPYQVKKKVRPIWRRWYVAGNSLRKSYDTYEVIERLQRSEFIPRDERH